MLRGEIDVLHSNTTFNALRNIYDDVLHAFTSFSPSPEAVKNCPSFPTSSLGFAVVLMTDVLIAVSLEPQSNFCMCFSINV